MSEVAILIPTLGRPHKLAEVAETFKATTKDPRIVFIVDEDDEDSKKAAAGHGEVLWEAGVRGYAAKVNLGVRSTREPYILLAADDVRPHPNWFEVAKAKMSNEIGYVSLNDLGNSSVMRGQHATFPLIARWYADLDDELYHEGYRHNYCDREASARARARGAYAYERRAVIEHMHPAWGKGEIDDTYREWALDQEKWDADEALFRERRHLWETEQS